MGREIDERVVQMKFENGQFEKGVQTSIRTMNDLKKSMNFEDSIKGFQELDNAASGVTMRGLGTAVDAVKVKFSALEIVAITALTRITNAAIDTGKRLVSSLSTDQISAGWDKYANKTSAVQTIMAATANQFSDTAVQMEAVNDQLNKLNWFTDETSYNFVDMVSNIGKFTSNNIDLETSVTAMQGIANWAAKSGANANEASRAMYNLSQALATGTVKLIDWKSIENANMATTEFKQTVIDLAVQEGTLQKSADGLYQTMKGTSVSVSNFNEALSEGWFTNNVLLKSLDKYGAAANRLNEIYQELDEEVTTSSIVSAIDDYTAAVKKAQTESESMGLSAEASAKKVSEAGEEIAREVAEDWSVSVDQAREWLEEFQDETMQFGLSAFKAAQEAKTFTEAIDSVKDAVSTGWMKSFEYLFGDYTEAKEFWTDIANTLYDMFAASGDARNQLLKDWKELGGREYFIDSIHGLLAAVNSILVPIKAGMQDAFGASTGQSLFDLTKKIHAFIGNLILTEENMEKLERVSRGLFSVLDILKTVAFGGVSKAFKLIGALTGDTSLDVLGFLANIADVIYNFRTWVHESTILNDTVDSLIDTIASGKGVLDGFMKSLYEFPLVQAMLSGFRVLANATFQDVVKWVGTVKKLLSDFFNSFKQNGFSTAFEFSFDNLIAIFQRFKEMVLDQLPKFSESFPKTAAVLSAAFDLIAAHIGILNKPLILVKNLIGHAIDELGNFTKKITAVDVAIVALGAGILVTLHSLTKFINSFAEVISALSGGFKGITTLLQKWTKAKQVQAYASAILMLAISLKVLSTIDTAKLWETGIALLAFTAGLIKLVDVMGKVGGGKGGIKVAAFVALAGAILAITAALSMLNPTDDMLKRMGILGILVGGLATIAVVMTIAAPKLASGGVSILAFALAIEVLIHAMNKIGKLDIERASKGISGLLPLMLMLAASMRIMGSGKEGSIKAAGTLLALAVSINMLIFALKAISKMDPAKALTAVTGLGLILAELAIAMRIMGSGKGGSLKVGGSLLSLAVALNLIAPALKSLASIDDATLQKGKNVILQLGLIFVAAIALSAFSGENAAKAGLMLIEMSAAITLLVVAIRALGAMEDTVLAKGVAAVSAVGLIFAAALAASKGAADAKTTVGLMAAAIAILAYSIYEMSKIDWKSLLSATMSMMAVVLSLGASMKLMNGVKATPQMLVTLAVVSALMAGFGYLIRDMSAFPNIEDAIWAAGAIGLVMVALAASLKIMSGSKGITADAMASLAVMSAVAAGLGGIILLLAEQFPKTDIKTALTVVAAIDLLLPVLSACFVAIGKMGTTLPKGATTQIVVMGAVMTALGGVILAISAIPGSDAQKAVTVLNALGVMLPLMVLCFGALSLIKRSPSKTMITRFAQFAAIAAVLGALIEILSAIPATGTYNATRVTEALEMLIVSLVACFEVLALIRRSPSKTAIKSFAMFSGIAAALGVLIGVFAAFTPKEVDSVLQIVEAVQRLIPVLSLCFAGLSLLGDKTMSIKQGASFAIFGALASAVGGIVAAFATYANLDFNATERFVDILTTLIPMLSGVAALFSLVNIDIASVTTAGLAIDAFAVVVGGFLALVGQLPTNVLEMAATNGELLGKAIGGFFGGIIGGIAGGTIEALASIMPAVGSYMTQFWENGKDFFDGMNSLDEGTLAGVGIMTAAFIALTAAEFLNAVALIPGLINNLAEFLGISPTMQTKFQQMGEAIAAFANELDGVDADKVSTAADAAEILSSLEGNLPPIGGVLETWVGRKDLGEFGTRLKTFGEALADFADKTKDVSASQVEGAANAGKLLTDLEASVPSQGGKLQTLLGSQNIATFGVRLVLFGEALVDFKDTVKDVKKSDVQGAYNAGKLMADLESNLSYVGGQVTKWFFGEKNLDDFGARMKSFGEALSDYAVETAWISGDTVQGSADALAILSDLEKTLDTTGGVGSIFFGDSSFGNFASNLSALGSGLVSYASDLWNVDLDAINNATAAIEALIALAETVKDTTTWGSDLVTEVGNMIAILLDEIDAQESDIKKRGEDVIKWIVQGLKIGVDKQTPLAKAVAKNLAEIINDKFRETLEIASPSAVMEENGKWIVRGIAEGIKGDMSAEEAIVQKAKNIETAFASYFEKTSLTRTTGDLDYQLWEVTEGLNADDATKLAKQREKDMADLDLLAQDAATRNAMLEAVRQQFGEASDQYIEASNNYKQALISMYQKKNEIDQTFGDVAAAQTASVNDFVSALKESESWADMLGWDQTQRENYAAKKTGYNIEADRIYEEYRESFQMLGKTDAELREFAQEKSGQTIETVASGIATTNDIIAKALSDQSVSIQQTTAQAVGNAIKTGVQKANLQEVGEEAGDDVQTGLVNSVVEKGKTVIDTYKKLGEDILGYTGLKGGLDEHSPSAESYQQGMWVLEGLINAALDNKTNAISEYNRLAIDVMNGFTQGIRTGSTEAISAAQEIASKVAAAMRVSLKVKSPSRVTKEIGSYVGQGLAIGMLDETATVANAATKLTDNTTSALLDATNRIQDILNSDDINPTITPVLDMDELKNQAKNIPDLLNANTALNLRASNLQVNSIAARQNARVDSAKDKTEEIVNNNYNMVQNNYSPKALNRVEIYRQTKNQFSRLKGATQA